MVSEEADCCGVSRETESGGPAETGVLLLENGQVLQAGPDGDRDGEVERAAARRGEVEERLEV